MIKRSKGEERGAKRADILQGTLDMLILRVLLAGPAHGYAIIQRIQQTSEDLLKVEEGSLYPALYRLEGQGWVAAEWGASENNRRAKYYNLTAAGKKQLSVETTGWARLCRAIDKVLETA